MQKHMLNTQTLHVILQLYGSVAGQLQLGNRLHVGSLVDQGCSALAEPFKTTSTWLCNINEKDVGHAEELPRQNTRPKGSENVSGGMKAGGSVTGAWPVGVTASYPYYTVIFLL